MKLYEYEFKIPYFDVDSRKKMRAESILKYLSEVSAIHNELFISPDQLKNEGYGWMLKRWKLNFLEYPKLHDEITIRTWISKIDKFFVNREFLIFNLKGEVLVKATALWIFINMKKRFPARIKKEYIDPESICSEFNYRDFMRFENNIELNSNYSSKIRRSDIDLNNHVNNLHYFSWMLESVEDEIYYGYSLKELEIDYKREINYPGKISVANKKQKKDSSYKIIHNIFSENTINAFGKTIWKLDGNLKKL